MKKQDSVDNIIGILTEKHLKLLFNTHDKFSQFSQFRNELFYSFIKMLTFGRQKYRFTILKHLIDSNIISNYTFY